jgi:hypothetical protein
MTFSPRRTSCVSERGFGLRLGEPFYGNADILLTCVSERGFGLRLGELPPLQALVNTCFFWHDSTHQDHRSTIFQQIR